MQHVDKTDSVSHKDSAWRVILGLWIWICQVSYFHIQTCICTRLHVSYLPLSLLGPAQPDIEICSNLTRSHWNLLILINPIKRLKTIWPRIAVICDCDFSCVFPQLGRAEREMAPPPQKVNAFTHERLVCPGVRREEISHLLFPLWFLSSRIKEEKEKEEPKTIPLRVYGKGINTFAVVSLHFCPHDFLCSVTLS